MNDDTGESPVTEDPTDTEPDDSDIPVDCAPGTATEDGSCEPCEAGTYCAGGDALPQACLFPDLDEDPATPCEVVRLTGGRFNQWCADDAQGDRMCWGAMPVDYENRVEGERILFRPNDGFCTYDSVQGTTCHGTAMPWQDEPHEMVLNATYVSATVARSTLAHITIDAEGNWVDGINPGDYVPVEELGPLKWGGESLDFMTSRWACALEQTGQLSCWNTFGEALPEDVEEPIDGVDEAWIGEAGLCATQGGDTTCWGAAFAEGGEVVSEAFGEIVDVGIGENLVCFITAEGEFPCRGTLTEGGWSEVSLGHEVTEPQFMEVNSVGDFCLWDAAEGLLCWSGNDHSGLGRSTMARGRSHNAAPNLKRPRVQVLAGTLRSVISLYSDGSATSGYQSAETHHELPRQTKLSSVATGATEDSHARFGAGLDLEGNLICNSQMAADEDNQDLCTQDTPPVYEALVRLGWGQVVGVSEEQELTEMCTLPSSWCYNASSLIDTSALQAAIQGHPDAEAFTAYYSGRDARSPMSVGESFCADKEDGSLPVCFTPMGEEIELLSGLSDVKQYTTSSGFAFVVHHDGTWGMYNTNTNELVIDANTTPEDLGSVDTGGFSQWWPGPGELVRGIYTTRWDRYFLLEDGSLMGTSDRIPDELPAADALFIGNTLDNYENDMCIVRRSDGGLSCWAPYITDRVERWVSY